MAVSVPTSPKLPVGYSPALPCPALPAVGKNLTYLSQLDGLTFQLYKDIVLPRYTEIFTASLSGASAAASIP